MDIILNVEKIYHRIKITFSVTVYEKQASTNNKGSVAITAKNILSQPKCDVSLLFTHASCFFVTRNVTRYSAASLLNKYNIRISTSNIPKYIEIYVIFIRYHQNYYFLHVLPGT